MKDLSDSANFNTNGQDAIISDGNITLIIKNKILMPAIEEMIALHS